MRSPTRIRHSVKVIVMIAVVATWNNTAKSDEPWVRHESFKDFAEGTFEDSGANLYVSHSGEVQMIQRWDFNNDGYLDLWVGQDHDVVENEDAFIYWGSKQGPRSILPDVPEHQPLARLLREIRDREKSVTRLPSNGGGRSLLVDLNNDGRQELQ